MRDHTAVVGYVGSCVIGVNVQLCVVLTPAVVIYIKYLWTYAVKLVGEEIAFWKGN